MTQQTKMTSIEWIWEQIPFEFTSKRSAFEIFEQAKEMHKIELEDAYKAGSLSLVDDDSFEQYYRKQLKRK
jgi:hypothetical protein